MKTKNGPSSSSETWRRHASSWTSLRCRSCVSAWPETCSVTFLASPRSWTWRPPAPQLCCASRCSPPSSSVTLIPSATGDLGVAEVHRMATLIAIWTCAIAPTFDGDQRRWRMTSLTISRLAGFVFFYLISCNCV